MERNDFLKTLGGVTAAGILMPELIFPQTDSQYPRKLKRIGVQLFSVPASLEKDFEGTIAFLAKLGFKEIELYGPYPFSSQKVKEEWQAITPMLGFSGSGYFGKTEEQFKTVFDNYGLRIPAVHSDLGTLENKMENLGKAAK
jgi:hypothetical protein